MNEATEFHPITSTYQHMNKPIRYVQVFTDSSGREPQPLDDGFALTLLQQQYGEEIGHSYFVGLAIGRAKCASVGQSMIEFRGSRVPSGIIPLNIREAIEGERAYQEQKWPAHQHTTAEWVLILEKLIADARREWVTGHGDNSALHEVRQIAATAIACMEQCGAPLRGEAITGRKYAA